MDFNLSAVLTTWYFLTGPVVKTNRQKSVNLNAVCHLIIIFIITANMIDFFFFLNHCHLVLLERVANPSPILVIMGVHARAQLPIRHS